MEILFYETFVTQTPISKPVSSAADCTVLHRIALALLAIAAIVVIAAVVALLVWVVPLATSGVTAEDAIPKVEPSWVTLYDEEGNAHLVNARYDRRAGIDVPRARVRVARANLILSSAPVGLVVEDRRSWHSTSADAPGLAGAPDASPHAQVIVSM